MNKLYRDTESGNLYTLEDMRRLYECSETEIPHFYQWMLEVCGKNGTMEEVNI